MEEVLKRLEEIRERVRREAPRVAELGKWPAESRGRLEISLAGRVPLPMGKAPGFDAGVACCLDIIPRDVQALSAGLHAGYTAELIAQIRSESAGMYPDDATTHWLGACSLHLPGGVDGAQFVNQVAVAEEVLRDPQKRVEAALATFRGMTVDAFELRDGLAFAKKHGGIQGAYLMGHKLGVEWSTKAGIWFVSTFEPSLGVERFPFSRRPDNQERPTGIIYPSFVTCHQEELEPLLEMARKHLGI